MECSVSSILTLVVVLLALLAALAIAIGLAYVPMRLLLSQMARNVREIIQRQRERRRMERGTPDRRHQL
jgi:flagellar biogenesis protein FliO